MSEQFHQPKKGFERRATSSLSEKAMFVIALPFIVPASILMYLLWSKDKKFELSNIRHK